MAATKTSEAAQGFHGTFDGVSLADMIQLNGINRFSGCITVSSGAARGLVFFRDGRVIHAEQGRTSGEEAFFEIMSWSSGGFGMEPNVSTTRSTIEKDLQHLIMAAHQFLDERRAAGAPPPAPPPLAPPERRTVDGFLERIRGVPGVAYATLSGRDGSCVGDTGSRAEALAGRAAYLAMVGDALGKLLSAGALRSAALQEATGRMLLLVNRSHHLSVLVEPDAELGTIEDEVRKLLVRTA